MLQADGAAGDWSPRQITASVALVALATMGMLAVSWLVRFAQQFYRAGKILEPIPCTPVPSGVSTLLIFPCTNALLRKTSPQGSHLHWWLQQPLPLRGSHLAYRFLIIYPRGQCPSCKQRQRPSSNLHQYRESHKNTEYLAPRICTFWELLRSCLSVVRMLRFNDSTLLRSTRALIW